MLLIARGAAAAIPRLVVRLASSVAAVGVAGWAWSQLDCSPLLFLQDKWMHCSFWKVLSSSPLSSLRQHQTLWIVGASSGIGEEFAYQWIQQLPRRADPTRDDTTDADVRQTSHLILSARSTDKLQEVAANCKKLIETLSSSTTATSLNISCQIHILPVDVTNYESLRQAVQDKFPLEKSTGIDMVLLNAGQGHLSPAVETLPETCQRMLTVNALWPQWLVSLLWQQAQLSSSLSSSPSLPRLLVTSSVAGHIPVPLSASYTASKFALVGYFRTLCCEDSSVQVTLFSPGPVATDFGQNCHDNTNRNGRSRFDDETDSSNAAAAGGGTGNNTNSKQMLKMTVQRCVRLMLTATYLHQSRIGGYQEVWISSQPALTALYLQRWFPGLTQHLLAQYVGPKRVGLWRQGLDLYDPANWKQ